MKPKMAFTPTIFTLCILACSLVLPNQTQAAPVDTILGSLDADALAARPRPWAVPANLEQNKLSLSTNRQAAWLAFVQQTRAIGSILTEPAPSTDPINSDAWGQWANAVRVATMPKILQVRNLGFLALVTGNANDLQAAKDAALQVARWDPNGATSYAQQDQLAREVALQLATVYDWFYNSWTPEERSLLLSAIDPRVSDLENSVLNPTSGLAVQPLNSHGWTEAGYLSAISILTLDNTSAREQRLYNIVPFYFTTICPWGGSDGGYANGINYLYAQLEDLFAVWDIIRQGTGLDPYTTPWASEVGDTLTYFSPPGAPGALFGDGSESGLAGHIVKAWSYRVPTPLNLWAAQNAISRADEDYVMLSVLPVQTQITAMPAVPNSWSIPSTGWVAFHSDLSNKNRTSFYFKSSQYGSYNHSHADQNGFILDHQGVRMLTTSGVYDYYGSPHWRNWYTQTKAHNALTFDDGQGQISGSLAAKGALTVGSLNGTLERAQGDAAAAYGGALNKAYRTVLHHRPSNTFFIFDQASSTQTRQWEWRLHSYVPFEETVPNTWQITMPGGGPSLCVTKLAGPDIQLTSDTLATPDPSVTINKLVYNSTWTTAPSTDFKMVTMISPDCNTPNYTLTNTRLLVGGNSIVNLNQIWH